MSTRAAEEWKRPDARTWQVSIASDTPCVGTTKLAAKPAPAAPSTPPAPSAAWAVQLIGDRLESNALSRYAQLQKKYQAILGESGWHQTRRGGRGKGLGSAGQRWLRRGR